MFWAQHGKHNKIFIVLELVYRLFVFFSSRFYVCFDEILWLFKLIIADCAMVHRKYRDERIGIQEQRMCFLEMFIRRKCMWLIVVQPT